MPGPTVEMPAIPYAGRTLRLRLLVQGCLTAARQAGAYPLGFEADSTAIDFVSDADRPPAPGPAVYLRFGPELELKPIHRDRGVLRTTGGGPLLLTQCRSCKREHHGDNRCEKRSSRHGPSSCFGAASAAAGLILSLPMALPSRCLHPHRGQWAPGPVALSTWIADRPIAMTKNSFKPELVSRRGPALCSRCKAVNHHEYVQWPSTSVAIGTRGPFTRSGRAKLPVTSFGEERRRVTSDNRCRSYHAGIKRSPSANERPTAEYARSREVGGVAQAWSAGHQPVVDLSFSSIRRTAMLFANDLFFELALPTFLSAIDSRTTLEFVRPTRSGMCSAGVRGSAA
jgi:hypothetical protein